MDSLKRGLLFSDHLCKIHKSLSFMANNRYIIFVYGLYRIAKYVDYIHYYVAEPTTHACSCVIVIFMKICYIFIFLAFKNVFLYRLGKSLIFLCI